MEVAHVPCLWRREERGVAYRGWVGPVLDRWCCIYHGNTLMVQRGKETQVFPRLIADDLIPGYRGSYGGWS